MAVAGKKVLMILAPKDFEDEEYDKIRKILEGRGAKITVASLHPGEIHGSKGMTAKADVDVSTVKQYDYDVLIFIGGQGARRFYYDHEKVLKLAEDAKYKTLGAISEGVGILANAKVLKERKVTGDRRIARLLEAYGADYTGQPVEVDDKIVTADGLASVELFGNALVQVLSK